MLFCLNPIELLFMKIYCIIAAIPLLTLRLLAAPDQSLDNELTTLADQLTSAATNASVKKIATLDFTDLQGNPSELGRFIAEQVAVNMVMSKRPFAVVDRANLKRILDEHKLSMSGLVNPENTKKLGQFSGVDAIILGRITPMADSVAISATITLTDTAEVVGGAKSRISKSQDVLQLLDRSVQTASLGEGKTPSGGEQQAKTLQMEVDKNSQQIGDLLLKVESLKHGRDSMERPVLYATLFFANTNTSRPISVALSDESRPQLLNKRGDILKPMELTGMDYSRGYRRSDSKGFTEVPAGRSVKALITFYLLQSSFAQEIGNFPPYRLTAEVFIGTEQDGRLVNVKKQTFMIDIQN